AARRPRHAGVPVHVSGGGVGRGGGGGGGGSTGAVPVPVTTALTEPPVQLKVTFVPKAPAVGGLNRTTTVWVPPGPRTNAPPEITVNGALVAAAPLAVLPPEFVAVNERSVDPPTVTDPKL